MSTNFKPTSGSGPDVLPSNSVPPAPQNGSAPLANDQQLYEYFVFTPHLQSFSWRGVGEEEIERAEIFVERISVQPTSIEETDRSDSTVLSDRDLVRAKHACELVLGRINAQLPEQVADSVSEYWSSSNITREDLKLVERFIRKLHDNWQ